MSCSMSKENKTTDSLYIRLLLRQTVASLVIDDIYGSPHMKYCLLKYQSTFPVTLSLPGSFLICKLSMIPAYTTHVTTATLLLLESNHMSLSSDPSKEAPFSASNAWSSHRAHMEQVVIQYLAQGHFGCMCMLHKRLFLFMLKYNFDNENY